MATRPSHHGYTVLHVDDSYEKKILTFYDKKAMHLSGLELTISQGPLSALLYFQFFGFKCYTIRDIVTKICMLDREKVLNQMT